MGRTGPHATEQLEHEHEETTLPGGRADELEDLLDEFAGAAYSLAYRICGRPELAERATRAAFLEVWRDEGCAEGDYATRLLRDVRARSIALLRAAPAGKRRRRLGRPWIRCRAESAGGPASGLAGPAGSALEALPARRREVLELAYFEGIGVEEIGARLGLSGGEVRRQLRLALLGLSEQGVSAAPDPTGSYL